jgi:hypothetical protein
MTNHRFATRIALALLASTTCSALLNSTTSGATAATLGDISPPTIRKLVQVGPRVPVVPNHYIVVFHDKMVNSAADKVVQLGSILQSAQVTNVYETVFKGVALSGVPTPLLHALERDPQVKSIHMVCSIKRTEAKHVIRPLLALADRHLLLTSVERNG